MAMTKSEAIKHLTRLRDYLKELHAAVRDKDWKQSEKAMIMARYAIEIEALQRALIYLASGEWRDQ